MGRLETEANGPEVGGGDGDVIVPVETIAACRGKDSDFGSDHFPLSNPNFDGRRGGADSVESGGATLGGLAKASSARA